MRDLTATGWLVLVQRDDVDHGSCPRLSTPLAVTLRSGDEIDFAGAIQLTTTDGVHESRPLPFLSRDGSVIRAEAGPIDVVVRPAAGEPSRACAPGEGAG